jgi:hypothetical protein
MIISAESFSNRIYTRFFRSRDVKRRLCYSAMEYEQGVIVRFLINEFDDAHEIHKRRNAQFAEQAYPCARSNSGCARYNAVEKISMMNIGPEDQRSIAST